MQAENSWQNHVIESIQCCVSFTDGKDTGKGGNTDALGEAEVPKVGKRNTKCKGKKLNYGKFQFLLLPQKEPVCVTAICF